MEIAIGLPAGVPGTERRQLLDWAHGAEQHGFSSLGSIDRIVYPNWEPLLAFAAAAAVTERIRLLPSILIAPVRNTVQLAKQLATLDQLSGGRLTVGLAIGARDDDYEASGLAPEGRGARLDAQVEQMRRVWKGEKLGYAGAVGPTPVRPDGPPLVFGGMVPPAFDRAARYGEGWIMGGGTPDQFREGARAVEEAWSRHGRDGRPRKQSLAYFALGPDARTHADRYIHDYYGWLGEEVAAQIAGAVAVSDDMVRGYVDAFAEAGCDELVAIPCSSDPGQVELLAAACGLS